MWALMWPAAPFVCFSQPPAEPFEQMDDSTYTIGLQEITVKISPVITRVDGNAYIPSAVDKRISTSGIDLLSKMQLPGISVNQLTGAVVLSGGGDVRLCINGVESTRSQIAAVRPKDVIRIEYHDNPGAKYAGVDAVIDYIVRHHESGGSISIEGMNAIGSGKWAAFDNLSGTYSRGASSFSIDCGFCGLHRDNWVRDYSEIWNYPRKAVLRTETGSPVSIGTAGVDVGMDYTLQKERAYYFHVRAGFIHNHVPAAEEGDRHTILQTSDSEEMTEISEHTRENSSSPSLAMFYRHHFGRNHTATANLSGSYLRSSSFHSYMEAAGTAHIADIFSTVSGRKCSMLAETYYDYRGKMSNLTGGIRHSQSRTSNLYSGSGSVVINRYETSLFGGYDLRLQCIGFFANLTANRFQVSQGAVRSLNYSLNPSLGLSYTHADNFRARYDARLYYRQPQLSDMSDVEQSVQPGIVRRGNPNLRSFRVIDQRLTLSCTFPWISADLKVDWRDEHNPAMSTTIREGELFVITYENQRSFKELRSELTLTLRPWGDHLSVAVAPALSRFFSYGNNYTHIRNIFHLGINLEFNYGCWTVSGSIMTGDANRMYGEEIIREKDMNCFLVGYRRSHWAVQAGVFNAFMGSYWMKSENMSELTPSVSIAHCDRNLYGVVKFSVDIGFGLGGKRSDKPGLSMPDTDAGIMDSTK